MGGVFKRRCYIRYQIACSFVASIAPQYRTVEPQGRINQIKYLEIKYLGVQMYVLVG